MGVQNKNMNCRGPESNGHERHVLIVSASYAVKFRCSQPLREYVGSLTVITAVPDNNDIEAIFTWQGHGCSFVGFLSGNVWQIHLDSDFLLQFLLRLFHKLAH